MQKTFIGLTGALILALCLGGCVNEFTQGLKEGLTAEAGTAAKSKARFRSTGTNNLYPTETETPANNMTDAEYQKLYQATLAYYQRPNITIGGPNSDMTPELGPEFSEIKQRSDFENKQGQAQTDVYEALYEQHKAEMVSVFKNSYHPQYPAEQGFKTIGYSFERFFTRPNWQLSPNSKMVIFSGIRDVGQLKALVEMAISFLPVFKGGKLEKCLAGHNAISVNKQAAHGGQVNELMTSIFLEAQR